MEKTLLQKYEIPVGHLDFAYIEKCENAREMEKIVKILRSNEEGFFPDLTRCAEEKLKKLKPDSKCFRYEEAIRNSSFLDKQELKPIYDWTNDIKTKDCALSELKDNGIELLEDLPPMRAPCKIEVDKPEDVSKSNPNSKPYEHPKSKPNEQRIKSTDYGKWDKYNPDEEILRMDLEEERTKEQAQIKTRKIQSSTNEEHIKICEQSAEEQRLQCQLKKLSQLEREQYGEKYRLRGNEYFKAKEYQNAIKEYTHSLIYDPMNAARSYNNRAICHIKLQNYIAAIDDCESCLKLEPENLKALLRLADANYSQGRRRESYDVYQRVLNIDPNNASALKSLKQLQSQLGELAPAHATRMVIEELQSDKPTDKEKLKEIPKVPPKVAPKIVPPMKPKKEYDLAELVKPNRVVKSKIVSAAEALGGQMKGNNPGGGQQKKQLPLMMQEMNLPQSALRLPQTNNNSGNNKLLIQEI